jgi:predicted DsbA family dithiol-disulfide isomerase
MSSRIPRKKTRWCHEGQAQTREQSEAHADPNAEIDRKLGKAFFEQESDISDLLTMANIAARASIGDEKGEAIFTAHHLRDMVDDFRQQWYDSVKEANEA